MAELICPVCGLPLAESKACFSCEKGHSFDRAKSGYVNLLRSSAKGKRHGDDKLMVQARSAFLDKGFYDPLVRAVSACCLDYAPCPARVLDAGCGEGKYTGAILTLLESAGKQPQVLGIDISKDALAHAAKRVRQARFAVASTAALPVADESTDLLVSIFAPFSGPEFARVLAPAGKIIRAYPLEKHLWELKQLVYDRPYENPPFPAEEAGFRILETRQLRFRIRLDCSEDIVNLFKMTPYYYKTGAADQAKCAAAETLETGLEFGISVYEKA